MKDNKDFDTFFISLFILLATIGVILISFTIINLNHKSNYCEDKGWERYSSDSNKCFNDIKTKHESGTGYTTHREYSGTLEDIK